MFQILHDVNIDWLGNRRWFIGISVLLMLAGLGSAIVRQATGRDAFNLGVDFKGGTVVTARFKQRPADDAIRAALVNKGINDAVVQPVTDRTDTVLIKVPLEGEGQDGRARVREALNVFGSETAPATELEADPNATYKIVGTDAVGAIAGAQLRNKAIAVTLAALVGILLYIAVRFEWTYGAAAVIAGLGVALFQEARVSDFRAPVNPPNEKTLETAARAETDSVAVTAGSARPAAWFRQESA